MLFSQFRLKKRHVKKSSYALLNRLKVLHKPPIWMPHVRGRTHFQFPPSRQGAMVKIMAKKPLEPLMPLEEFKKLVAAISRVPKEAVEKDKAERKRRKAEKLD